MRGGLRLLAGSAVCALVLGAGGVSWAAPVDPGDPVAGPVPGPLPLDRGVVLAVERDLGMSWEEFVAHGRVVERASVAQEELEDISGVVDVRIDDQGEVVVAGHGSLASEAARSAGLGFVEVLEPVSPEQAREHVEGVADVDAVVSVGHSVEGTTVSVDPGQVDVAEVAEEVSDVVGLVVQAAERPEPRAGVGGGHGLRFTDGAGHRAECLTGFSVRDLNGGEGWLTAGHCTFDGAADQITAEVAGRGRVSVGSVGFAQFGGVGNAAGSLPSGTDLAVVQAGEGMDAVATVPGGASGPDDVVAWVQGQTDPVLGAQVCRYSAAGWGCGEVVEVLVTYLASGPANDAGSVRTVTGFMVAGLGAEAGDSGGPVITGGSAVGVVTAGATVFGADVVYAVPVSDVARHVPNARVQRGVPWPVAEAAVAAGPGVATAAWQPGDSVAVTVPGAVADDVEVLFDGTELAVTGTADGFSFTVPASAAPAPARHRVELVAVAAGDRSLPLAVYLPVEVPVELAAGWTRHGGADGALGLPRAARDCASETARCFQRFDGGRIYGGAGQEAVVIKGAIHTKWLQRREVSQIGYPVADEVCGLRAGGCEQRFDDGVLVWSPAHGAFHSRGAMLAKWTAMDRENGVLGYPTGDHTCRSGTSCYQLFAGGALIWSAAHGVFYNGGEVRARYGAEGFESGWLGFPVDDLRCALVRDGCQQTFENGAIWWSPGTGARTVKGAIGAKYAATGWEAGLLGYPTGEEICGMRDGGCRQDFQGGTILWSPATGAHYIRGQINDKYSTQGRENGWMGYPSTDELCGMAAGGCRQHFQGQRGAIYWSPGTGAKFIRGQIMDRYVVTTAETGPLGYPTSDEICGLVNGGCFQKFQTATNSTNPRSIYYSPAAGTWDVIHAGVLEVWAANGWERGKYGYPKAAPGTNQYGRYVQQFQGGTIETTKP